MYSGDLSRDLWIKHDLSYQFPRFKSLSRHVFKLYNWVLYALHLCYHKCVYIEFKNWVFAAVYVNQSPMEKGSFITLAILNVIQWDNVEYLTLRQYMARVLDLMSNYDSISSSNSTILADQLIQNQPHKRLYILLPRF